MATIEKIRQVQLVGRKIRQLRKEHKLTQVELSARLGIQQSDLSRMEQGEYRVSLDTLFRILAEFKMSIGEFFEGVANGSITPRDVQLVQDFNALPRDAQREAARPVQRPNSNSPPAPFGTSLHPTRIAGAGGASRCRIADWPHGAPNGPRVVQRGLDPGVSLCSYQHWLCCGPRG
jgi:transcriptional regulator with XRE-family HTH domain